MSRFQFELATPDDDQQLRAVLEQTPMPGRITLTLEREPSFFQALAVEGSEYQVIACRDRVHGRIIGLGTRSVRLRYIGGQPCRVGYLGSLRLLPEFRSASLVARGYHFFKELAQQYPADWHFTSITDDNHTAVRLLTSGRAGLPSYRRIATLMTLVLTQKSRQQLSAQSANEPTAIEVRPATALNWPAVVDWVNSRNALNNFALHLQAEDLPSDRQPTSSSLFRDLHIEMIQTAWSQGKLTGALGVWNQSLFKQIVVRSMPSSWRWLRPIWNGLRALHHQPRLLRSGDKLPSVVAALLTIGGANEATMRALLLRALQQLQTDDYFLLAIDSRDTLYEWLRRLAYMTYQNGVYLVGWDADQIASYDDTRPIAPELGCL